MNVEVKVPTITANVGPIGLNRYAGQFLSAALGFKPKDKGFSPVPYYLCCRSLELVLKSYLLAGGMSRDDLKKQVGHDLDEALRRARGLGLDNLIPISASECSEVTRANQFYKHKDFEYFENVGMAFGLVNLPSLEVLTQLASRLMTATEPVCTSAVNAPV